MSRRGWVAATAFGVLVVVVTGAWLSGGANHGPTRASSERAQQPAQPVLAADAPLPAPLRFQPFTPGQVDQFLTGARRAEAIADPLQRCLTYPDPPGSHWNAEAVKAYCQYRNMPSISFEDARRLIESGHAAELDRQLADALHKQFNESGSRGLLDHIYQNAFYDGAFEVRTTLDAWKRDSPRSAFAYAASGMAYTAMASDARGGNYIQNTSDEAILSMDRLAQEADADLRQAIALDPRVTPAYAAMMDLGRMTLGRNYARQAFAAGSKISPANFDLYATANVMAPPKWGGSWAELRALQQQELAQASVNPLLYLDATDAQLRAFDFFSCRCATPPELAQLMQAMDSVGTYGALSSAGDSASSGKEHGIAAVYYAEAIRFANRPNDRLSRAFELVSLGYPSWAHDEVTAMAPMLPNKGSVYRALGYADIELQESSRAISELEQAVRLDYTDTWSWESLGMLYGNAEQWDKAWDAADQLIRQQPDSPAGWRLRGEVQMAQPRAGLADTVQTFAARFGNRPDQQEMLKDMQHALATQKH